MREIKFRVWNNMTGCFYKTDRDRNSYWDLSMSFKGTSRIWGDVEQYTGLLDKSGVEIYEGDIIQLSCGCCVYEMVWQPEFARFWYKDDGLSQVHGKHINVFEHIQEVIGNIHENPELLAADAAVGE